jgi:hypothetical protein
MIEGTDGAAGEADADQEQAPCEAGTRAPGAGRGRYGRLGHGRLARAGDLMGCNDRLGRMLCGLTAD